jgi:hypothetical protein
VSPARRNSFLSIVTLTATLDRTGQVIVPSPHAVLPIGHYVIIDDGSKNLLRARPDTVMVTVSNSSDQVDVPYQFRFLGCSVEKVSGPDSLELQ